MKKTICSVGIAMIFILMAIPAFAAIPEEEHAVGDPRDAVWQEVSSYQLPNRSTPIPSQLYAVFYNFLYTNDFTQAELSSMSAFAKSVFNMWGGYRSGNFGEMSVGELNALLEQAIEAANSVGATLTFSGDAFNGTITIKKGGRTYVLWAKIDNGASYSWDSWYTGYDEKSGSSVPSALSVPGSPAGDGDKVIKATGFAMDFSRFYFLIGTVAVLFAVLGAGVYIFTVNRKKES